LKETKKRNLYCKLQWPSLKKNQRYVLFTLPRNWLYDLSQFLRKMQQETDNNSGERAVAFAQMSKAKRYVFGNDLVF